MIKKEYEIIETLSDEYNIKFLCKMLEVSRSGYYKWLQRKDKLNQYERNREDLKSLIIPVHESHKTYGYRNIAQNIRNMTGWLFSDWLCHKCCLELLIKSKARKKRFNPPGTEHDVYPNLLNGDFTATRPFEKVCTDTTMIYNSGKLYDWNIYIDLFNKEIIAYDLRLSKHGNGVPNHFTALNKFQIEKQKRGYNTQDTILHSDQGNIYTSRAFNARLHYTIKRSMSRIATPTDNPVIESMNGWIKDELVLDFDLRNNKNIHKLIRDYVKYYNNIRLSYSLKYKSPIQYKIELDFS
jgi:transposase InsO family protein